MNTESIPTNSQRNSSNELSKEDVPLPQEAVRDEGGVELPDPDPENITVLTQKLPNKPILPWNRFDSPWCEEEAEAGKEDWETIELQEGGTERNSVPNPAIANSVEDNIKSNG